MPNIDRRNIDSYLKKVAVGFILFLLTQGVIGVVTAVQVMESVKQNSQDVKENKAVLGTDSRAIIRMEVKLQTVTEDISDIKAEAKETRRLIRTILREVKK